MLDSGLARANGATGCYLAALSECAAGRYLEGRRDALTGASLQRTLRIAYRKTVSLEFVAPLVAGALLAGGDQRLLMTLRRTGWHAGVACHLRRDVLSLFREPSAERPEGTLRQARMAFPVTSAYARAPRAAQHEMADLLSGAVPAESALPRLRELVEAHGGLRASERSIAHAARAARRLLGQLSEANGARRALAALIAALTRPATG
jgi:geranylgeranyl diphosphate synthase type II